MTADNTIEMEMMSIPTIAKAKAKATGTTETTMAEVLSSTKPTTKSKNKKKKPKTLALLYPTGLFGGYRNQAMRFIGFIKLAVLDDNIDQLLLPTLLWSTRYHKMPNTTTAINPIVTFWPVPFNELFDVKHWNTFHLPNNNRSDIISLPLLVSSIDENEEATDAEHEDNDNDNDYSKKQTCWKSENPIYNITNYNTSLLPPLTYRMLFGEGNGNGDGNGNDNNDGSDGSDSSDSNIPKITSHFLEPLYDKVIDFLMGDSSKKFHRLDYKHIIENCTIPYVSYSSGIKLWNQYVGMEKRSPSVLPNNNQDKDEEQQNQQDQRRLTATATTTTTKTKEEQQQQQQTHHHHRQLRLPRRQYNDDDAAQRSTRLVKTVDGALIPAKPWRLLAKKCVDHHLTLNHGSQHPKQQQTTNSKEGFGYIALHARIEPEMLVHKCGIDMERNLTKLLNLVENLSIDYNSNNTTTTTTNDNNNNNNNNNKRRKLEGVFVAVGRDLMQEYEKYGGKIKDIALYNWNVLNDRTTSYDNQGNELFTSSIERQKQRWTYQQNHEDHLHHNKDEDEYLRQHNNSSIQIIAAENTGSTTTTTNNNNNTQHSLPIFECGEGWVEYGFYKDDKLQHELLTTTHYNNGSNTTTTTTTNISSSNRELLLPNNYYGDILPSIINFWLAVNSDIFVGVMKSSWSNAIWTTRYYQGKGLYNFQYTNHGTIIRIENNGLPPPHKNC
jgi:hypothetical protein